MQLQSEAAYGGGKGGNPPWKIRRARRESRHLLAPGCNLFITRWIALENLKTIWNVFLEVLAIASILIDWLKFISIYITRAP